MGTDDAREFRYDGGRERYLARHWTPPAGQNQGGQWSQWAPDSTSHWTDYLGEQPRIAAELDCQGEARLGILGRNGEQVWSEPFR